MVEARTEPFPRHRRVIVDSVRMAGRRHLVYGLLELDVTEARRRLREREGTPDGPLSLTAFVVGCFATALAEQPRIHAYRDWRNRLVVFDGVDVTVLVETELDGRPVALPHVLRNADERSLASLSAEIRAVQEQPGRERQSPFAGVATRLPGVLRRQFYRLPRLAPLTWQRVAGSAAVTSVGMFGRGGGWGIAPTNYTVQLTVGGIAERPAVVADEVVHREFLAVTASFDHDVVDGAPAARFLERLRQLVEEPHGLAAPATG